MIQDRDVFRAWGERWEIRIVPADPMVDHLDTNYCGKCHYRSHTVILQEREVPQDMRKTLLHEFIHLCSTHAMLKLEEDVVVRMENAMWALMQDNPRIWAWILEGDQT